MPKAIRKVAHPPKLERKKRVAAYARVSSGKDAMLHSLSSQVAYYSALIHALKRHGTKAPSGRCSEMRYTLATCFCRRLSAQTT